MVNHHDDDDGYELDATPAETLDAAIMTLDRIAARVLTSITRLIDRIPRPH